MASGVIEQVPRYTMSHTDDGLQERLQLTVNLPGVTSAQEFEVCIQTDNFILRSPGRYNLVLPLHAPVEERAESLQFVKKKQILKAELKVLPTAAAAESTFSTVGQNDSAEDATPAANSSSKGSLHSKSAGLGRKSKAVQRKAGTYAPATQHKKAAANGEESDSSVPGLDSNSDTSPTFSSSPGVFSGSRQNDDATSDHSEHASSNAEGSCSDESSSSPQIKHWPHSQDRTYTKTDCAHGSHNAAPAERQRHPGFSSSDDDDDDDGDDDATSIEDFLGCLRNGEMCTEDAFSALQLLMRQSESQTDQHLHLAAHIMLDAQLQDGTTAACLQVLVGTLDPEGALAVQSHFGAALAKMLAERMRPEAVAAGNARPGSAKSAQQAREQAELLKLLQALDHPVAEFYQDAKPATAATQDHTHRTAPEGQSGAAAADATAKPQPQNLHHPSARRGKKRAAASQSAYSDAESSIPIPARDFQADTQQRLPKQQQQQKQAAQGMPKEWATAQASTSASYGPEQQAEAKRQAKKEAALALLDKAKTAAASKDWALALQRAHKAMSLNPDADFAQEVHALIDMYRRSQQSACSNSSHSSSTSSQTCQADRQHQHQHQPEPAPASATQKSKDAAAKRDDSKAERYDSKAEHNHSKADHDKSKAKHDNSEAESTTYGQYSYTYANGRRGLNLSGSMPWEDVSSDDDDEDAAAADATADAASDDAVDDADEYFETSEGTQKQCYTSLVETLQSWSSWLQRSAAPVWRYSQQGGLSLLKAVMLGFTVLLTAYLASCDVLPLLLHLTGRRQWRRQLQKGKEAGAWWARVLLYIVSPGLGLLMAYSLYRFIAGGHFVWVVKAAALGAALPFRKTWGVINFVAGWFNFGWTNLPIIFGSRYLFKSWWPALLSSTVAVWYVMGCGWLGILCSIVSALVTFFMTFETVSVPAAMIVAYLAITNSYITGSMLKGAFVIVVGVLWWIWAENFRKIAIGEYSKQKSSNQSTAPPKPMSRGSTDSKAEIQRILSTSCHYTVLEVDTTAEEEVVRRAKRTKSLLVHPDKVGNLAGASDAFGKVTDAAEVLCDPYKRRQYDAEQAAAAYASQASSSQRNKPEEEDDPNVHWQRCTCCGELHRCIRTDKTAEKGRWCKDCNCFHSVKLGQGWVTRTGLLSMFGGGEYVVYACLGPDGAIYDVTEATVCQGMLQCQAFRMLGPDCCKIWLTFGSPDQRKTTGQRRQRERYEPPNETAGGRKSKRNKGRRRR